jgi:2-keto-4-pentenoate hydratase
MARLHTLRSNRKKPRADYLNERGRRIHGPTAPGGSKPCPRESDLTPEEVKEVRTLIAHGRRNRTPVTLPERLKSRSWKSVEEVLLQLEYELGWEGGGWKVGAASLEVRAAENIPSPSPGRLFKKSIFESPAVVPSDHFVNYRLCEFEFAFQLNLDFPIREKEYSEADVRRGIDSLCPAIEIGDSVFEDWYSVSGYFGGMYDNGGGAAFVVGKKEKNWQSIDLPKSNIDVYINDNYIKSGQGYSVPRKKYLCWRICQYGYLHSSYLSSARRCCFGRFRSSWISGGAFCLILRIFFQRPHLKRLYQEFSERWERHKTLPIKFPTL